MFNPVNSLVRRAISAVAAVCFLATGLGVPFAHAQDLALPIPGTIVHLSPRFDPPVLKGIKVYPENPLRFDFVLDRGTQTSAEAPKQAQRSFGAKEDYLKTESLKLIKYFLASITTPEKDLWVNLSPYERDRIIPNSFGLTEMGRDLLAEDYMLKQLTASLMYPGDETGRAFWKRIYVEAAQKFGTINVPVSTFNKVWIVPEKAVVYENAKTGTAYIVTSKLKVMLEEDYLALERNGVTAGMQTSTAMRSGVSALGCRIVRDIVIPQLTQEVNAGRNFAHLRQVYQSLILATWYKKKIKDSILSLVYADKNKTAGVNIDNPREKENIYQRYLQAFKKGAYNLIKEEQDPATGRVIPRKYFSGGVDWTNMTRSANPAMAVLDHVDAAQVIETHNDMVVTADAVSVSRGGHKDYQGDAAMESSSPPDWAMTDAATRLTADQRAKAVELIRRWNNGAPEEKEAMLDRNYFAREIEPNYFPADREFLMYALYDNNFLNRRRVVEINSWTREGAPPRLMPIALILEHLSKPWVSLDEYGTPTVTPFSEKHALRNKRIALLSVFCVLLKKHYPDAHDAEHYSIYEELSKRTDLSGKHVGTNRQIYERRDIYYDLSTYVLRKQAEEEAQEWDQNIDIKAHELIESIRQDPDFVLGQRKPMSFWEILVTEIFRYRWKVEVLGQEDKTHGFLHGVSSVPKQAQPDYIDFLVRRIDSPIVDKVLGELRGRFYKFVSHDKFAKVLYDRKNYFEARMEFGIAINSKQGSAAENHYNLGLVLKVMGERADALREFKRAQHFDTDFRGHYNLGLAFADMEDYPNAILEFEKAINLEPADADIHNALGGALWMSGSKTRAMSECEEALRIDPNHIEAKYNLELISERRDSAMRAVKFDKAELASGLVNKGYGGIDFKADKMDVHVEENGGGIQFKLDPAMLRQFQNTMGFVPVIINVKPLKDLPLFLGLPQQHKHNYSA